MTSLPSGVSTNGRLSGLDMHAIALLVSFALVQVAVRVGGGTVVDFCREKSLVGIGETREVTVVGVEHYGIYVEADDVPGLILIPELSWQRVSHPSEIAKIDDRIRGKVIRVLPDATEGSPRFMGSIRELHPERNPWFDPSVYAGRPPNLQWTTF